MDIQELKRKAEGGDGQSQSLLGTYYHDGKHGLVKCIQTAIYWYQRAAANGDSNGLSHLGGCYANGEALFNWYC